MRARASSTRFEVKSKRSRNHASTTLLISMAPSHKPTKLLICGRTTKIRWWRGLEECLTRLTLRTRFMGFKVARCSSWRTTYSLPLLSSVNSRSSILPMTWSWTKLKLMRRLNNVLRMGRATNLFSSVNASVVSMMALTCARRSNDWAQTKSLSPQSPTTFVWCPPTPTWTSWRHWSRLWASTRSYARTTLTIALNLS